MNLNLELVTHSVGRPRNGDKGRLEQLSVIGTKLIQILDNGLFNYTKFK